MKLICDTDLLSVFAKTMKLDLLREAFAEGKFVISESVYDEPSLSMEEGFDFPEGIFKMCDVVGLSEDEVELYKKRRGKPKFQTISKADLRTLILAKERNLPILSNDSRLLELADQDDVLALDIYDVLKILFKKEKLTEKEVRDVLSEMEERDNAVFKAKESIFE